MNLRTELVYYVEDADWNEYVKNIYSLEYKLQQQGGCYSNGTKIKVTIPCDFDEKFMAPDLDQQGEGIYEDYGVKLDTWLNARHDDYRKRVFHEKFYPNLYSLMMHMYDDGNLEEGTYIININF